MLQNITQQNICNQDTTNRTQVSSITVFPVSGVLSGNKHRDRKAYSKEYNQRPEVKKRILEYKKRPDQLEKSKEYSQKPEVKERMKEYHNRPEQLEKRKIYRQNPEVKRKKAEYNRARRTNPEIREKIRDYKLVTNFNLTLEEYNKIFKAQKGVCYICEKGEIKKSLAVDHNHKTGKVRGLLCQRCNRGIGYFLDDTKLLERAISYLQTQ